jgi:hypothetical protein
MNLDTYLKYIHQVFDEFTVSLKQILFWYRESILKSLHWWVMTGCLLDWSSKVNFDLR